MHGKVFLASALGGGIGALVALQVWQPFWWVGMLVGGLLGYLSYDFKEVIRAIPTAWRMATEGGYFRDIARFVAKFFGSLIVGGANVVVPLLLALWGGFPLKTDLHLWAELWVWGGGLLLLVYAMWGRTSSRPFSEDDFVLFIRRRNPFMVYGYYLPKGLWWLARRTPRAVVLTAVTMARFVKYLFILIHSELRLLCAFDAALGAAIGYFLGSAAIGALAGGVIGVLNFELVSKRLLHLVPSR